MLRTFYSRTLPVTLALVTGLFAVGSLHAQGVAINTTGAAPNAAAMMDITSTNRGMLMPRVTYTQRNAIPLPATGLWVYQTDDGAGPPYNPKNASGLWYFNGTQWVRMTNDGWSQTGNSGTTPGTGANQNYLGTVAGSTDPLYIRTNGTDRVFIDGTTGNVGVNTNTPAEVLSINGALRLYKPAPLYTGTNYSVTNNAGVIRFDNAEIGHTGNTSGTAAGWHRLENEETLVTGQDFTDYNLNCGAAGQTEGGNYMANTPSSPAATRQAQTPFPTGATASSCGSKSQYLFLASELSAPPFNLCSGNFTSVDFICIDDDNLSPAPGAAIDVYIKIEHTNLTTLSGIVNLTANVSRHHNANLNVGAGYVSFPLTTPFNWNGVQNIIIEVSYKKAGIIGVSPRVHLETGLGFQSTAFAYHTSNTVTHGSAFLTPSTPTGLVWGVNNTRPVIRFSAQVKVPSPFNSSGDYALYSGGALMVGDAAWAAANYRGPGTIRAENKVYDGATQLTDHVFDRYFDHTVRPEDARAAAGYNYVPLNDLKGYLEENRHLPSMPSRTDWEGGAKEPVGSLSTGIWETVETQALYIAELERDLKVLESLAYDKGISKADLEAMMNDVRQSPRLTEDQRSRLLADLQERYEAAKQ
ncbi:MAG: hypothetical protein H6595_01805 [Flavobacteriales bacterium]|nr:hypothetical protein [Flavobacteriales bacterium]MCB9166196.1 hypothetical protein [Flavobacteriales bacterium]